MSALIVPAHMRPRVAEHQPVGMRTDDHVAAEFPAHVDDGRGPAHPTKSTPRRAEPEPTATLTSNEKSEDKPTSKARGLSVRSSEKPGKKK
jgi:hypothetical protein